MEDEKNLTSEIKQKNRQLIYNFIRDNDLVSKQGIVYGLQLSLPTVTQNLQYLLEEELIDDSQQVKFTGGRNATAYSYNKRAKIAVGLDLTMHHIRTVVMDLSGEIIEISRIKRDFKLDDSYYKCLGENVEDIIKKTGMSRDKVLGVGIAVPGLVSEDGQTVTYGHTLNFTGATINEFGKYISFPRRLFHDVHAAGFAEVWADKVIENAVYISLGNSIGGAVIVDSKLYYGEDRISGEVGHLIIEPGGELCYCGNRGCMETRCNALKLSNETDGDLSEFFCKLKEGDPHIKKVWDEYLDYLSLGIYNTRILFNGTIILGGYVGAYIEDFIGDLIDKMNNNYSFVEHAEDYIISCKYKIEVIAAGAALMYIDAFINNV